jgi:peptidoglycan/xylan/chitin deacetylase (PgdA/CDA1 family)
MDKGMPGQFLVRFDDLCPTMNWSVWDAIESTLVRLEVKPIVSVVPDNRDPFLAVAPPNENFWSRVREWQSRGWTIAAHGYQHRTLTSASGVIGINARSEFAGLSRQSQEGRLNAALAIFRTERVSPSVWAAPNHSFDQVTVSLLRSAGIGVINDGLRLWPFRDEAGTVWVPHQIWRFRHLPTGVWTVGCHHNGWDAAKLRTFQRDLFRFREHIVDMPTILRPHGHRRRNPADDLVSHVLLAAIRAKRIGRAVGLMQVADDAY